MNKPTVDTCVELMAHWDYFKNEILPKEVTIASSRKVWWKCTEGGASDHEWYTSPLARTQHGRTTGCPFCSNYKVSVTNNLLARFPEIAKEWHPTKNNKLITEVVFGSDYKAWWKCEKNHEWKTKVYNRTQVKMAKNQCLRRKQLRGTMYMKMIKNKHTGKQVSIAWEEEDGKEIKNY